MLDYWRWASAAWDLWLAHQGGRRAIEERQARRLGGIISWARQRSRFYRQHLGGLADSPRLADIPPVTRGELMSRFEDWVTDAAITRERIDAFLADTSRIGQPFLGRYTVWTSSGTTGVPGIYVHDEDAVAVYDALQTARFARQLLASPSLPASPANPRYAMLGATGGHFAGAASVERLRRMNPLLRDTVRVFSILQPVGELVAALNEFQPAWVATYPSVLEVLAEERAAGRLKIRPTSLWSGGETFTPAARSLVERSFGVRVVDEYGSSEFMNLAASCPHGWLHVNADWVILEPVDREGRPTPPGEPSATVLLTNLANRVQPFIRYDIGDSITASPEPCPCGSPLPAIRVEGRRDDVLSVARTGGGTARLLPLALSTVIEEAAHVHHFQVVQTADDTLAIRLDPARDNDQPGRWERVQVALTAWLRSQGADTVLVVLDPSPPEARGPSGKLRQVVCARSLSRSL